MSCVMIGTDRADRARPAAVPLSGTGPKQLAIAMDRVTHEISMQCAVVRRGGQDPVDGVLHGGIEIVNAEAHTGIFRGGLTCTP